MWKRIRNWFEVRIGLDELIKSQLTEYRVPRNINIFYTLGFVALAAFVIQTVTGFFLLIYYVPHPDHAFRSVQDIMNMAPFGWLFRLIHVTGSNLMVAVVLLHMLSVFFMGSYKVPREITWVNGVLMMLLTLAFCLSGYLLPWSQLSYWATTIVSNVPSAFPYIGDFLSAIMRGGTSVSGMTLKMFFAAHVGFVPFIFLLLLGLHLFLVRRIGVSAPPFGLPERDSTMRTEFRHDSHPDGFPFFPHFFMKETFMITVYLAVMFFIIAFAPMLFLPDTANVPADPLETPARIKPEWYFLAPYQMLKLIPNKFLGISVQMLLVTLLLLWPFLDIKGEKNILKRPLLLSVFFISLVIWITLTLWGHYS